MAVDSFGGGSASEEAGKIAFEIAKGRLDRQATRLAEIRTNSSVLLAASALIASFLGTTSIDRSGLDAANWVAVLFLVAGVLFGIRPLWPVRDPSSASVFERFVRAVPFFGQRLLKMSGVGLVWRAAVSTEDIVALDAQDSPHVRLLVAQRLAQHAQSNGAIINRRSRWVAVASICLFAQVTAWTISLTQ